MIGHCHRARFRPSARALFPELASRSLTPRLEGKPSIEVPVSELPISRTSAEASVDSIVLLNRQPVEDPQLISLPAGTATEFLRRNLYSAGEIRTRHEWILGALWDTPTFEMQYSDLEKGIRALALLTPDK